MVKPTGPVKFSNPRKLAVIEDYPIGGSKRGRCTFEVESNGKGERCLRTTSGRPKADTYARAVVIVDGDNGRTYILKYSDRYGQSITISRHDFMNASGEETGKVNSAYFTPDDERWLELVALVQMKSAVS